MAENVHVAKLRMGDSCFHGPQCDIHEYVHYSGCPMPAHVRCGAEADFVVSFDGLSGHIEQHVCDYHRPKNYPIED